MSLINSNEFFINIKNPPVWDPNKHYFEQSLDALQFFEEERRKCIEGVNIGGYFVHPWLYFHVNFYKTPIPFKRNGLDVEEIINPPLDDNILYTVESYQQAQEEQKGVCLFGSRGVAKALRNDQILYYEEGEKPIGEAKVGDKIFGADGKLTTILGVYPQGMVDLYEIELYGGQKSICCGDHIWQVHDKYGSTITANLLIVKEKFEKEGNVSIPVAYKVGKNGNYKASIYSIKKIDPGYATCIRVDNEDHLFLTNDRIITHNSSIESSLIQWTNVTRPNGTTLVAGGDAADLAAMTKLLQTSIMNCHPAMFVPLLVQDWSEAVEFGIKTNQLRLTHSHIAIRNANRGKKSSSEKGAGGSPTGFVVDEIGKFDCIPLIKSALPSFRTQSGMKLTHLLSGTGGSAELSADAKKILSNPKDFDLIMMNWDRLDRSVPEEAITWKGDKKKKFGTFFPAQMSYRHPVPKIDTTLAEYLNIYDDTLLKIKLKQTDWENASKWVRDLVNNAEDEGMRNSNKMYYPTEIDHCFLTESGDKFIQEPIQRQLSKLRENPAGRKVELSFAHDGKSVVKISDRGLAEREYKGKPIDAPIVVYGDVPEYAPEDNIFCGGLDDYKLNESTTTSLGVGYILKRRLLSPNQPCEVIAMSYAARPNDHRIFYSNFEKALDIYNGRCNMESADTGFIAYLQNQSGKDAYLLTPAIRPGNDLISSKKSTVNSKYGTYPTPANQTYMMNLVIDYANTMHSMGIDSDGNQVFKYGSEFIEDPWLLEEMLDYKPGANVDRIIAFGHALLWCRELDKRNVRPIDKGEQSKIRQMQANKPKARLNNYGKGKLNNYRKL